MKAQSACIRCVANRHSRELGIHILVCGVGGIIHLDVKAVFVGKICVEIFLKACVDVVKTTFLVVLVGDVFTSVINVEVDGLE